ncbi:ATP-dependent Clp protease proteolytic subunit [Fodinicola feengrottensis]|uniref:ATP-dependent Clp protease proteolytic subunit n=1 Tax=Fodinicola feengrottensis TaxID=435914 RepID=A0ABN2IMU5_9ACTN
MTEMARVAQGGFGFDGAVFEQLLRERIVFLTGEVKDENANTISAQLLLLAAEDPEAEISLYINSPGGSVSAGMAIYDTMQFIQPDVSTYALGFAASMGQLLLCAGAPGKRFALPHARVVMHQALGGMGGTATDIAIQAEQLIYTKRVLQERTAFHTGQTYERIEADADRDRWFTAQEAKDYGFVDEVIPVVTRLRG